MVVIVCITILLHWKTSFRWETVSGTLAQGPSTPPGLSLGGKWKKTDFLIVGKEYGKGTVCSAEGRIPSLLRLLVNT